MNVLNKINIIGSEIHGDRYRDAALFYPTVETLTFNAPHFADYDTVILAEPYLWGESFAERLVCDGFCGLLILEKMQFCSWASFDQFRQKEYPYRICHAMLRLYEDRVTDFDTSHLTIRWPNLVSSNMDQIIHTLPNVLLFCHAQFGIELDSVKEISRTDSKLELTLADLKHHIDLEIYNTRNTGAGVQINDVALRWPNYIQLIHRLFDAIREGGKDWRMDESIIGKIIKVMELT